MPAADRARRLIHALTGVDPSAYKENVLLRKLRARAREAGFADAMAYLDALEARGPEAQADALRLVRGLSAPVSGFFRDPAVFEVLEKRVFPLLFQEAGPAGSVRAWSAGCSRGQEAYSLAASLWRTARRRRWPGEIEVVGTDLDPEALAEAGRGVYGPRSLEGLSPSVRDEVFEELGPGTWRVRDGIRGRVRFRCADLLDAASHLPGMDLICCRNLLIYLRRTVQEDLILALRAALRPGGFLVLGASETVLGRPWKALEHVDPSRRIYRRPASG